MKITKKISELKDIILTLKNSNKKIGLVPTMGNIHEGHLSLISKAKKNDDYVITTIFVNPTQFNNKDDYLTYPNTFEEDVFKLKSQNCNLLFMPSTKDLYPKGLFKENTVKKYRNILCDLYRPKHFDGVTTIVNILFDIIKPDNAYFGEKDYQQLKIIQELVKIKKFKTKIIQCPSIRDKFGMSLSSRNSKLNSSQKLIFQDIAKKIQNLKFLLKENRDETILNNFTEELVALNINKVDYIEIRSEDNLEIAKDYVKARIFIALYIDDIRVIDNFKLY